MQMMSEVDAEGVPWQIIRWVSGCVRSIATWLNNHKRLWWINFADVHRLRHVLSHAHASQLRSSCSENFKNFPSRKIIIANLWKAKKPKIVKEFGEETWKVSSRHLEQIYHLTSWKIYRHLLLISSNFSFISIIIIALNFELWRSKNSKHSNEIESEALKQLTKHCVECFLSPDREAFLRRSRVKLVIFRCADW